MATEISDFYIKVWSPRGQLGRENKNFRFVRNTLMAWPIASETGAFDDTFDFILDHRLLGVHLFPAMFGTNTLKSS